jgi:hypothetical protein
MTDGVESQATTILRMLRNRPEGITAMDALTWAGSFRLAARIADLRAAGHDIRAEMVTTENGKRVARYRLVGPLTLGLTA